MGSGLANFLNSNPIALLSVFVGTFLMAYLIAWYYRREYDPKKYVIAYGIYFFPLLICSVLLKISFILIFGIYLFGAIVLIFRNQHYFDQ